MEKILDNKTSPAVVGFCQALGVVLYTILIATLIFSLGNIEHKVPEVVFIPIMLSLLVLSAGLTGTFVFGLPVYFTFAKNNVVHAMKILFYTFATLSIFVVTALVFFGLLTGFQKKSISNFEECAAAGNPVMESYPRKCSADDETFTEEVSNEQSN